MIFAGLFTFFGKPSTTARVDTDRSRQRGRGRRLPGRRHRDLRSTATPIGSFSDMQRIVSIKAGEQLDFAVKRGEPRSQLNGDAGAAGSQGHASATCIGSACSASPARQRPATSSPSGSIRRRLFGSGVKETWFVVDRTFAYIGGVFTGREAPIRSAVRCGSPRSRARSPPSAWRP